MRRGITTRLTLLVIATLTALIYLAPTFISKEKNGGRRDGMPDWWSGFLPAERIHLGLDLQGGTHLVLEVKVDKAVENSLDRIKGDLSNILRERGLSGVGVERIQGAQLQMKVPAADVERVRSILNNRPKTNESKDTAYDQAERT